MPNGGWHDQAVEFTFSTREDGQVDATIVGEHPGLNEALADSISSLPPRGAPGRGPSTYWIDVARAGSIAALESGSDAPREALGRERRSLASDSPPRLGRRMGFLRPERRLAQRTGIGTALLARAGRGAVERAAHPAAYLWVLEQNTAARQFYRACGGERRDKALVPPPGGLRSRLNGSPFGLRIAWPDVSVLARLR
jgi:hypothetical protein